MRRFWFVGLATTSLPADVQQAVVSQSLQIIKNLNAVDGMIHVQFIWDEGNPPSLLKQHGVRLEIYTYSLLKAAHSQCVLNTLIGFHKGLLGDVLSQNLPMDVSAHVFYGTVYGLSQIRILGPPCGWVIQLCNPQVMEGAWKKYHIPCF